MRNQGWVEYFHAIYLVWGTIGVLVAVNYGSQARAGWRSSGGTWRNAPRDWAGIVVYVIRGCCSDLVQLVRDRRLMPEPSTFTNRPTYSPGHLLRFFIMMSFITSAIFGFMLVSIDRSAWHLGQLLATATAVSMSVTAGLGHLFIAWRFHARRWRWTAALAVLAVPIGMAVDHWLV